MIYNVIYIITGPRMDHAEKGKTMVITILEGYNKDYVLLKSNHQEFMKTFGRTYELKTDNLYIELQGFTAWANNEIGEECLFEIG